MLSTARTTTTAFLTGLALFALPTLSKADDSRDLPGRSMAVIHVDEQGSDSGGDGSMSAPFRTLQTAGWNAAPGATVFIHGGTYEAAEDSIQANGTAEAPIVIMPYPGETVILDATASNLSGNDSVLLIHNSSHLVVSGFEIRNSGGRGISLWESEHITLRDNYLHNIEARAIGGGGSHITIENNVIENAVLHNTNGSMGEGGWASAIGPYKRADGSPSDNWIVRGNTVSRVWGEGINGYFIDTILIEGNTVYDTYGPNIYLDHAIHATVNRNYLYSTDSAYYRPDRNYPAHGVSMANEAYWEPTNTQLNDINITNNLIVGTGRGINYWQDEGNDDPLNTYRNVRIAHNTIVSTFDTAIRFFEVGPEYVQPSGVVIRNNIVYAGANGEALELGNSGVVNFRSNNFPNGVPAEAGGADTFSADPQFTNPLLGGPDHGFRLQGSSSSRGAGRRVHWASADFERTPRSFRTTLGAFEE